MLIGAGLTLVFGVMKVVNFAHGEFLMIGMYLGLLFFNFSGIDPLLSSILVLCIVFLLGAGIEKLLIEPTIAIGESTQMILTLGLSMVLANSALLIFGTSYQSVTTFYSGMTFALGGAVVSVSRLLSFTIAVIVIVLLLVLIERTDIGRALRATAEKSEIASLMGIKPKRMRLLAFGIGAAIAGAAGAILLPYFYVFPNVGSTFILLGYVVVVMGGLGNLKGAILAGLALGLTESFASMIIPTSARLIPAYFLFVIALLYLQKKGG